jgi:hypothetical protein
VWWPIPAKRTLWSKETINKNYLLNIIHHQKVRAIPLPRPPRRPLKNVTAQISQITLSLTLTKIIIFTPLEDLLRILVFWERAGQSAKTSPPFPVLKIKKWALTKKAH